MKWTPEAKRQLETLWNLHTDHTPYTDEASGRILGTTTMAVARMRSTLGLVSHKVGYHTRDAKTVKQSLQVPPYVLYYKRAGQKHFNVVETDDEFIAKQRGRIIMHNLGVKTAYVFKPHCQLVIKDIVEIKL